MADPALSPMSQVLQSIGLTKEDLMRHSDQMRQFLTTQDANSLRAFTAAPLDTQATIVSALGDLRARSRSLSLSCVNASAGTQTSPPSTPVKSEPTEPAMPLRQMDSMEAILERKNRQAKREKRGKKEKERGAPSPAAAGACFSLDAFMRSRHSRRVLPSDQAESSTSSSIQVCFASSA